MIYWDFDFSIIYMFIVFLIIIGVLLVIGNLLAISYKVYNTKLSSYECGFQPFNAVLSNFDIKYYLIAILFLLFDLEMIFLIPWVFSINVLEPVSFFIVYIFFLLLILGFYYEWYRGGLEWA
jgi:NADH-quinone oxidoreductase subunit A